jgi:hypothetical protein
VFCKNCLRLTLFFAFGITIPQYGFSQSYFDKAYDINQGVEFGWSILINTDSEIITLSPGYNLSSGINFYNFTSLDLNGALIDNKAYAMPGYFVFTGLSHCLFPLTSSGSYMFGGSIENDTTSDSDVILVKFNSDGDTLFQRRYFDSLYSASYYGTNSFDNKVILVGAEGPLGQNNDILFMKADTNGNLQWKKTYGGNENNLARSVFENEKNQYVIGGVKVYNGVNANPWIIITDTSGNVIKEKEFVEPFYSCGVYLGPTLDNKFLLSSCVDTVVSSGDYYRPSYIAKFDTNFNKVWETIFNYPLINDIYIAKQLSDSSIIFIGFQEGGNPNGAEGWIGKIDKNGIKLWEHQYRHSNSTFNYFTDFQQIQDGGFVITGSTNGDLNQDLWLVKLDSMGCLEPCFTNSGTIETGPEKISLQCYPNPANKSTMILFNVPDGAKKTVIKVNDLAGRIMSEISLDPAANSFELQLENFLPGVYLITLWKDNIAVKSSKLIVN